MLTFNGRPFNPDDFSRSLEQATVKSFVAQVRDKFGSIRHPTTGEFATVVASGVSLDTLRFRVEASAELLEIIRAKYAGEDLPVEFVTTGGVIPKVFLSYAWENKELASKIANALLANSIDTWWAEWCISSGDSLRQKIDEGLGNCTHFVVLLTPESIHKPWVNQEMDAGLMRKLDQEAKFIPLRHNLSPSRLPLLLRGMHSPEVDSEAENIQQLVNDIHGVTRKPPLGPAPAPVAKAARTESGYSAAATSVAEVFVKNSSCGRSHDPQIRVEKLMETTGLSRDDIVDALHELTSMTVLDHSGSAWPKDELFSEFDKFWMPWDPAKDGLQLAADLVNVEGFPEGSAEIAARYGWEPRRMNSAITYLTARGVVRGTKALGVPYVAVWILKNDDTRRFVKSSG